MDKCEFGQAKSGPKVKPVTWHDADYARFEEHVRNKVASLTQPLFTTNVTGLSQAYLNGLEADRKHYDCNCCLRFIDKYGGLATMDESGDHRSALWNEADLQGKGMSFFSNAVGTMRCMVALSSVNGVFTNGEALWGTPKTGIWTHLSGAPTMYAYRSEEVAAMGGDKGQDFQLLYKALHSYTNGHLKAAIRLLESSSLDRGSLYVSQIKWLLDLLTAWTANRGYLRTNLIWKAVATAPSGWCRIANNVQGTLLDDVKAGLSVEAILERWDKKVHPLQYRRPTAAPGGQNVTRANEIIKDLGLEKSMARRIAKYDEVFRNAYWRPVPPPSSFKGSGVFDHLRTYRPAQEPVPVPARIMTMVKFKRDVLPTAKKLELQVAHREQFFAMVTAEHPDAPPLLAWDREEVRNPVSWFYVAGLSESRTWNLEIPYGRHPWVEVTGVFDRPCFWNDAVVHTVDKAALFTLRDCRPLALGKGGLYFLSLLRPELREIGRTLEAHSEATAMTVPEGDVAAGLSWSVNEGGLYERPPILRVNGTDLFTIDRWE